MISHIRIRARSRLYRSQLLQANIRLKAFDEIYKIYMLSHRPILKNAYFRRNFAASCANICKFKAISHSFGQLLMKFATNFKKF